MRRKLRLFDLLFLACFALVILCYFSFLPSDDCIPGGESYKQDCTVHGVAYRYFLLLIHSDIDWGIVLTTLATAIIAIFTFRLWRSTHLLWNAGELQREQFRRHSEQQLRAYVHVHKRSMRVIYAGDRPYVYIRLKNTGVTPAIDLQSYLRVYVVDKPYTGDFLFEIKSQASRSILPPGGETATAAETDVPIDQTQFALLRAGQKIIYVNGRVEYKDVFGNQCWTNYRAWSDGAVVTGKNGKDQSNLVWSHDGNICDQSQQ